MRAVRDIEQGTTMVDEAPLYLETRSHRSFDSVQAFEELDASTRRRIVAMGATPGDIAHEVGFSGDQLTFLRVLRTNGVALPGGGTAVYEFGCRVNHSCQPNAALCAHSVESGGRLRLTALRPIAAGETIHVSYIGEGDLTKPTERRQKLLSEWGFQCNCMRCSARADDTRGFLCTACGSGIVYPLAATASEWCGCSTCGVEPDEEALTRSEEQWKNGGAANHDDKFDIMAPAFYNGLVDSALQDGTSAPWPDAHWVGARLAGPAAESFLAQGKIGAAVTAARVKRNFVRRTLGNIASRATAEALGIEAAAAALKGDVEAASRLYKEALHEISILPRTGDHLNDLFRARLAALPPAKDQQAAPEAPASDVEAVEVNEYISA